MDKNDVETRAKKVIFDHLGDGECWNVEGPAKREHKLGADLGADSLDLVEIVMALEDEFGVDIPDNEIEGRFCDRTVGDLLDVAVKYALTQSQAA